MVKNEKKTKKDNGDHIIRNIFGVDVALYGMLDNYFLLYWGKFIHYRLAQIIITIQRIEFSVM